MELIFCLPMNLCVDGVKNRAAFAANLRNCPSAALEFCSMVVCYDDSDDVTCGPILRFTGPSISLKSWFGRRTCSPAPTMKIPTRAINSDDAFTSYSRLE